MTIETINDRYEASDTPDAEYRFFVFDPMDVGFKYFKSPQQRDDYTDDMIHQWYLDEHWDEEVDNIVAGEVTHTSKQFEREDRPAEFHIDGNYPDWPPSLSYKCDYRLEPILPEPPHD